MTEETTKGKAELKKLLKGYALTTAEILYRLPDYPTLLQTYIWQEYDLHPRFPKLQEFLAFWESNLDGKLYRVSVAHTKLVRPVELRVHDHTFALH